MPALLGGRPSQLQPPNTRVVTSRQRQPTATWQSCFRRTTSVCARLGSRLVGEPVAPAPARQDSPRRLSRTLRQARTCHISDFGTLATSTTGRVRIPGSQEGTQGRGLSNGVREYAVRLYTLSYVDRVPPSERVSK
eukprot:7250467-Prymnesium_polylepis.1